MNNLDPTQKAPKEVELIKKGFKFCDKIDIPHHDYKVLSYKNNTRIIKSKNNFSIEINDVIQKDLKRSVFSSLKDVLLYLFESKVFVLFSKKKTVQAIQQKTYRTMKEFKTSEVEIAFDITYKYGQFFWEHLVREYRDSCSKLVREKNTMYYNNSYNTGKAKRWKWKFYNKSLKDRRDNKPMQGDVYRLEITVGRDWIRDKTPDNIALLKRSHCELVGVFEKCCSIGLANFFGRFEYKKIKAFIEDIKSNTPGTTSIPNTTGRNWKNVLKQLLFQTCPVDRLLK